MRAVAVGLLLFVLIAGAQAAEPPVYRTGLLLSATPSAGAQGNCVMLTVYLEDVLYQATQCSSFPWKAYAPHEFTENSPVEVRLENDKLALKRPNGKELKAKIVKRIRWDGATPPQLRRAGPTVTPIAWRQ